MPEPALVEMDTAAFDERFAELRIPQRRAVDALTASMRRFGQISPVVGMPSEGGVVLLDGFKRLAAARNLTWTGLTVRILSLKPRAAVAAVYGLNQSGRGLVDLEQALVVRKLVRDLGMSQAEVGELLDRHKSWVSRRLALVERLADDVQNDVRVGLLRPTVARELVRLPRGNQPEVASAVHRHGLTSREASLLVALFERATSREEQETLLEQPRDVLEAHAPRKGPPHDARLGGAANQVRRHARAVSEAAARLVRSLDDAPGTWTDPEQSLMRPILEDARASTAHAAHTLEQALGLLRGPGDG